MNLTILFSIDYELPVHTFPVSPVFTLIYELGTGGVRHFALREAPSFPGVRSHKESGLVTILFSISSALFCTSLLEVLCFLFVPQNIPGVYPNSFRSELPMTTTRRNPPRFTGFHRRVIVSAAQSWYRSLSGDVRGRLPTHKEGSHGDDHSERWHRDLLQGLGHGAAGSFQPRLAAECRRI